MQIIAVFRVSFVFADERISTLSGRLNGESNTDRIHSTKHLTKVVCMHICLYNFLSSCTRVSLPADVYWTVKE